MKKNILVIVLFLNALLSIAQEAESLKVLDTRNIESLPSYYKKNVRFDFKTNQILKLFDAPNNNYSGILTIAPWIDDSGAPNSQLAFNGNGLFHRIGYVGNNGSGNIIEAKNLWNSWNKIIMGDSKGIIQGKLDVNGTIRATEVKIEATGWADFVFDKEYKLPSLTEIENHIETYNRLPDVPSERDVKENGVDIGSMQILLLQKIEQLTLYIIELNKTVETQQNLIEELQKRPATLNYKK
ncbi:hypothetical protein [Dysgonomonas sp. ZJ279]|uniref:hypothetical protein n=1 Tax=Dysgonomonas sp. ZJ279 TaxID=2709796 RepID=UPI0013EC580C|nr:hypothetical protein [Dysgonomonas sp. ZJ279]